MYINKSVSISSYIYDRVFSLFFAAEAGSDFVQQNTTIIFPVGSSKREIMCGDIVIVEDNLDEEEEEIVVHADIIAPSTALFGSSLDSSSGKIKAIIGDDEEDRKSWLRCIKLL